MYPAGSVHDVTGICCGRTAPELGTRNEITHSGSTALLYSGDATNASGANYAYLVGFDLSGLHLVVGMSTTLSYWIYPQSAYSSGNNSTCVAVDLIFSDGTNLRDSKAVDQSGHSIHPASQCNHLTLNTWNKVTVNLGTSVNGKMILRLDIGYDQPSHIGGYHGYLDDLSIAS